MAGQAPLVFLCYHSADRESRDRLVKHLRGQEAAGKFETWDESRIPPGADRKRAVAEKIDAARVAVFLISVDFIGSEDIRDQFDQLLLRRDSEGVSFVPVIVKSCAWEKEDDWLANLRMWSDGQKIDSDESFADVVRHILDEIQGSPPTPKPQDVPPYRGLQSFGVDDADLFFGRQDMVEKLLDSLRACLSPDSQNRCLALVGSSGSGKSSVARAGLLAAIRKRDVIEGGASWPVIDMPLEISPLKELAREILDLQDVAPQASELKQFQETMGALETNVESLGHTATLLLRKASPERCLLVLVDQCEQLFTRTATDAKERDAFLGNLHHAATVAGGRTVVVLCLRADFSEDFRNASPEAEELLENQVWVRPMTDTELRQAIEEPMRHHGGEIEAGLADLLLRDVQGQEKALPLLQYTLEKLWRMDRRLTVENYKKIGGLAQAIQNSADVAFDALAESDRQACKQVLLHLVQSTGTERYSHRSVDQKKLVASAGGEEILDRVVEAFVKARLLTTTGTRTSSSVEMTHGALMSQWKRFREWLDDEKEFLAVRASLESAAEAWIRNQRDSSFLYRGSQLRQALVYLPRLVEDAREFLETSRRRHRARQALGWAAAAVAVAAGLFWGLLALQLRTATTLSQRALDLVESRPRIALLLAAEAQRVRRTARGESALRLALARCGGKPLGVPGEHVKDVRLDDDDSAVLAAIAGNDGLRIHRLALPWEPGQGVRDLCSRQEDAGIVLATLSSDNNEATVTVQGGQRVRYRWTPSGCDRLLSPSPGESTDPGAVPGPEPVPELLRDTSLWDAARRLHGPTVRATTSDRWAVTWGDGSARLWDLRSKDPAAGPEPRIVRRDLAGSAFVATLGNDRIVVAESSGDSDPRILDLEGNRVADLRPCAGGSGAFALSPDGRWLLRSRPGEDRERQLCRWDLQGGPEAVSETVDIADAGDLTDVEDPTPVAVSPDGRWLLASWTRAEGDRDNHPVRLVSADERPEPCILGHLHNQSGDVRAVFAADGQGPRWLATGSGTGAVLWDLHVWDLRECQEGPRTAGKKMFLGEGPTRLLAASPEIPTRWILAANDDTAQLVNLTDPDLPSSGLSGLESPVTAAAFSPDGRWLVTGESGGRLVRWNLKSPDDRVVLGVHPGSVRDVAFFADSESLVSLDGRGGLFLWSLDVRHLEDEACRVAGERLGRQQLRNEIKSGLVHFMAYPFRLPGACRE